jgi:general L-amino acid transport system permease protein
MRRPPATRRLSLANFWHDVRVRAWLYQVMALTGAIALGAFLVGNAQDALARQGITTGFAFLANPAGFEIGEHLIAFDSTDTFLRAYGVALLNTLKVAVASIVLATIIGIIVGAGRLSTNLLARKLASAYVEVFRNTPQLVLLIFCYTLLTHLPAPRAAISLGDVAFLSNRGLAMPWFAGEGVTVPVRHGFNFVGGITMSPEFLALLMGLSLYIGAFIAEIVRSGILSVGRGQVEAAKAIGLGSFDIYRKVIFPQALRGMVPPAAVQYVSIVKNSSLGVAIGYPELFSVTNTVGTLSGQMVEAIAMMMAVYLGISFSIAALMNAYNRTVQIKER